MLYPYQINTKLDLLNSLITIKNKSEYDWQDLRISLTDGYAEEFFFRKLNLKSQEEKTFDIVSNLHFKNYEYGIDLRITYNHKLIYHRKLNEFRKKTFIIYSNKKFEGIAEQLLIGLTRYSEYPIIFYTIDFDSDLYNRFNNLTCKRLNYEMDQDLINDGQFMQMLKPQVFLQAINDGFDDIVFLDTDIQVTPKVYDIFNYFNDVDYKTPVLNRQYWHYVFAGPDYVPGPKLMNEMGYRDEKQFQGHGITNIFLFRKEMKDIIENWKNWCQNDNIVKYIRKEEFVHDELIFNLMTWKDKIKFKLVNFAFNVRNLKDVKAHTYLEIDENMGWFNFNDLDLGHLSQSFCPYHRDDTIGYHCVKDPTEASLINDFIFNNFKKNSEYY